MKTIALLIITMIGFIASPSIVCAKGSGGHGHSKGGKGHFFHFFYSRSSNSTMAPGTGSKSSYERVNGYTTKDGKQVDSYNRSTVDASFNNNWSTKGNVNPLTGKKGSRVLDFGTLQYLGFDL
jgi:hypothetical protein